jgi:hypothetical protein
VEPSCGALPGSSLKVHGDSGQSDGCKLLRFLPYGSWTRATIAPGLVDPADAAVLTNPISSLHMVGMRILSEASGFGLLCREQDLLLLGYVEEPTRRRDASRRG